MPVGAIGDPVSIRPGSSRRRASERSIEADYTVVETRAVVPVEPVARSERRHARPAARDLPGPADRHRHGPAPDPRPAPRRGRGGASRLCGGHGLRAARPHTRGPLVPRMILSENRYPLFGIMRAQYPSAVPSLRGSDPPISTPRSQSIQIICPPPSGLGRSFTVWPRALRPSTVAAGTPPSTIVASPS
jgi:hypothetical protein